MQACLSPNGQMRFAAEAPPTRLAVATASGVALLERDEPGQEWRVTGTALEGHHVSAMTALPGRPGFFAGTHGDGIYFSADGGTVWAERDDGVTRRDIYTLAAVNRKGRVVIYAGTEPASLFRSVDDRQEWQELPAVRQVPGTERWTFPVPPHLAHIKMLAFDPRDPDTFFAAIEQGALLKTADGGQTWRDSTAIRVPMTRPTATSIRSCWFRPGPRRFHDHRHRPLSQQRRRRKIGTG